MMRSDVVLQGEAAKVVLKSRPNGMPDTQDFALETFSLPPLREGEILQQIEYLSIDPYMRVRMSAEPSYAPPMVIGETMPGHTIGRVLESRDPALAPGDAVLSYSGWQSQAVTPGKNIRKLGKEGFAVTTALGVHGTPGLTAYGGLLAIGQPKAAETVVVAAATGPVGSVVGQIACLKGARAVGIAGGAQKCALLLERFGFDAAVDHRSPTFAEDLRRACPNGIDIYFENVGGAVLEAVLPLLNEFARIPLCGLAAQYNDQDPFAQWELPGFLRRLLFKSATVRGFLASEFEAQWGPLFRKEMGEWLKSGQIQYLEDVVDGLENAPAALIRMLSGGNLGKLVIRL